MPDRQIWDEFIGKVCPSCLGTKRTKNGFCQRCYYSLPKAMQSALWNRFGAGYEEAHVAALHWLKAGR